jgi:hypothetical protein
MHAAAQGFVRKGAVPYLYFRHRVPVFVDQINNKLPQNQSKKWASGTADGCIEQRSGAKERISGNKTTQNK